MKIYLLFYPSHPRNIEIHDGVKEGECRLSHSFFKTLFRSPFLQAFENMCISMYIVVLVFTIALLNPLFYLYNIYYWTKDIKYTWILRHGKNVVSNVDIIAQFVHPVGGGRWGINILASYKFHCTRIHDNLV